MRYTTWIGCLLVVTAGCGEILENVEMVPVEKLPGPVTKVATERLPGVKFDTAWKEPEKKNGEDVYEVRGKTSNGKTRDIKVTESGTVLEVD